MRYYLAIAFEDGTWSETFGSLHKEDVDYEVECWKYGGCKARHIHRKTFQRMPTEAEIRAFAATFQPS